MDGWRTTAAASLTLRQLPLTTTEERARQPGQMRKEGTRESKSKVNKQPSHLRPAHTVWKGRPLTSLVQTVHPGTMQRDGRAAESSGASMLDRGVRKKTTDSIIPVSSWYRATRAMPSDA